MAVLGLRFCARAFSSCGKRGPLFIAVRGPLTVAASPVVEHRLQTRRLSNRGSRAQLLPGMWDLPRPGLEPVSPALAGRLSATVPPGKPLIVCLTLSSRAGYSLEKPVNFWPVGRGLVSVLKTELGKMAGSLSTHYLICMGSLHHPVLSSITLTFSFVWSSLIQRSSLV